MWKKTSLLISLLSLIFVGNLPTAQAQEIKIDGDTATIVTRDGNRITIDGNTLSRDGKNLFHSFQEFGLTPQQIATFLTNPNIQNILTRVTGGNPSYIQGLIEVTGGNSNLFIMNPAGIVFGQGASLNVPADFTATTATGIGFANGMFNAVGSNDYQYLIGNPNSFIFNTDKAGSIINAGYLAVTKGQNFTLIGGNVINTGTIETPDGKINIQGVQGTSRIKITTEGSLLSLEVDIPIDEQGNLLGFTPQDLPTLLTGANSAGVSTENLTINPETGGAEVSEVLIPNESGIAVISGEVSNSSPTSKGGEITVLGNKVALIDADVNADGATGGGEIKIGGDFQGNGTIPNASLTVVNSSSTITANATDNGNAGEVIIWADGDTYFTGSIEAKGGVISGEGGFVEVSGKENLIFNGEVDTSAVNGNTGILLLDPENIIVSNDPSNPNDPLIPPTVDASLPEIDLNEFSGQNITINATVLGSQTANIILEANNDIDINSDINVINTNVDFTARANRSIRVNNGSDIITNGGNITLNSDRDGLNGGSIDIRGVNSGDVPLNPSVINANGGNIILGGGDNPLTNPAVGIANVGINPNDINKGIYLQDANLITNGAGNISLRGTGQAGAGNSNIGVHLVGQTTVQTVDGNITLIGTGEASGSFNHGIDFASPDILNDQVVVEATGLGNIELVGTHEGNGINSNYGIVTVGDNSANPMRITSNSGSVTLNGLTDASSDTSRGISIDTNSQVNSIGGGNINFNAHSINNNDAIGVFDNGAIITSGLTTFNTLFVGDGNGGGTSFPLGSENDIFISSTSPSDFATVAINNARNVTLTDINNVTLANVDSLGNPGDIAITGVLDLRVVGITNINSNIQANSILTDSGGSTVINTNSINTTNINTIGDQTYGDEVILNQDTVINTNNLTAQVIKVPENAPSPVSLTINAQENITISGEVNDTGIRLGISTARSNNSPTGNINLDAQGDISVNGAVNTSADVDFVNNGNFVSDAGDISLTSGGNITALAIGTYGVTSSGALTVTGNNLNLGSIISNGFSPQQSSNGGTVTLTGTNINVQGAIFADSLTTDGIFNLSDNSLIVNVPIFGEVLGRANVTTINSQNYNGNMFFASPVALTTTNNGGIAFSGVVNGATNNLTLNSGDGNITFNQAVSVGDLTANSTGISTFNQVNANSLTTDNLGTTLLNGNVTTTGNQTYGDEVIIGGAIALRGDNLTFNNTVNSQSGETNNLTINGNNAFFNQAIGNNQALGDISLNNTGETLLNQVNSNSLTSSGLTQLNGNITTTGNQTYGDEVIIGDTIALSGDNLNFNNTVNSETGETNNLTVNGNNATFSQAIGNNQPLGEVNLNVLGETQLNQVNSNSLTSSGLTQLNGNITTTGNQTYGDEVIIGDTIALRGDNLTFNNTVNSQSGETNNLTVNGNNAFFNQAIGNNQALGNISLNNTGETLLNQVNSNSLTSSGLTQLNGDVTTTGNQTYGDEVIIGGAIALRGDNLTFNNTVNSQSGETNNLTINGNNAFFNQAIGNNQALGNISLNNTGETLLNQVNSNSLTSNGLTQLNGNVTTTGNQTYGDEVIIGGAIALRGDNLTFNNTVNSQSGETNNLTINGNNAFFNQAIGNNQALGDLNLNVSGETQLNQVTANSLTTDNVGTTLLNGNVTTTGNQTYNDNLTIPSDVTSLSNQGSLNFNGEVNASNNLTLISFSGINFADSQNITGNNGDLTLQTIGNRTINIGNIANQFSLTNLDQVNGFANIKIGGDNTSTININETLTVNDPLTLTANNINVNQQIRGNDNASITIKGNRTTTTLNADITTQGNAITIDDNVLLGNDITLSTNSSRGSADIDILGTINGNHDLILNANGSDIFIRGAIGSSSRLNNLETNASLTTLNGSSILTNGSQIFNSDIELGANTTFDTPESFNSQNISSENNNLTISAQTINTENINTNGGNVNLNSKADGDIQVNTINTSNPEGRGGDVEITTAGNFRATGAENGISINTNGGEGGVVTIDLFPGDLENQVREDTRLPFIVGDGTENGTAGIIANNNFTIGNGEYFITTQRGNLELKLLGRLPSVEGTENVQQPPITPPVEVAIAPPILPIATIDQAQEILTAIERESTEKPALIYVSFTPKGFQPQDLENEFARREATNTQEYSRVNITKANLQPTVNLPPAEDDQLDILIVTQDEKPLRMVIPVTRKQVLETAGNLWAKTSDVFALDDSYKPYASDMYNWLIKPIEKELEAREISNLLFILPTEMRFIPVAALYDADNQQFLVEKYSSGLAPSLNLNDNRYRPLKDAGLLAMGASTFADSGVVPLPAAGLELPSIRQVWTGERPDNYQEYLNENFTLEQIKNNLNRQPFGIVHFGTHGDFNPTDTNESFLQLYDSRLNIRELSRLGLNDPLVELLVLSACETAFGNEIAELGFAGLAVQAGVKTAMGSVWQVSDTGTLALMTDFYGKLKNTTTKAEALRQAQLDMLKGRVYKTNDGNTIVTPNLEISLDTLPDTSRFPEDFSHPFYWAPFTMIGNPW